MGLFSFRKPPARVNSSGSVPHTADLLYPAVLPAFSEIAAGEHRDPRAVFYTIRFMDPQRSRPFTPDVLDASDFGSKAEVPGAFWSDVASCRTRTQVRCFPCSTRRTP